MLVRTRCNCGHVNQSETSVGWAMHGSIPISCEECGCIYIATASVDEETHTDNQHAEQEEKTEFEIASRVTINNKESDMHQMEGIVIDKDFLHYKVKFPNGKAIWFPHHWIVLKKTI